MFKEKKLFHCYIGKMILLIVKKLFYLRWLLHQDIYLCKHLQSYSMMFQYTCIWSCLTLVSLAWYCQLWLAVALHGYLLAGIFYNHPIQSFSGHFGVRWDLTVPSSCSGIEAMNLLCPLWFVSHLSLFDNHVFFLSHGKINNLYISEFPVWPYDLYQTFSENYTCISLPSTYLSWFSALYIRCFPWRKVYGAKTSYYK